MNAASPVPIQRPPAEVQYADQLSKLARLDTSARPPGWALSLHAARAFIVGDGALGIEAKVVIPVAAIERMLVTLASGRGLMLAGEPGTAKSLLSELLAAAVSGCSTTVVQGGALINLEQLTYGWNYALMLNARPSLRALVPGPLYQGMREGGMVRLEDITHAPLDVQEGLLGMLAERTMQIPELDGDQKLLHAADGFNVIATASTRDRGISDMSAGLKRRFDFETVAPIREFAHELALVERVSTRLLDRSGVAQPVPATVLDLLVTTFRDLRAGVAKGGTDSKDKLHAAMSTADAVHVAHAVGVRAWYLEQRPGNAADLVDCIAASILKDHADDRAKLRLYFEQRVAKREGDHWRDFFNARHRLP
jgi:MoxR-like ATPase